MEVIIVAKTKKKKKSNKPTYKEKKREKRKAMVKLTSKQIKDLGLQGASKRRMKELESFREHVIKVHVVGEESNITVRKKNTGDGTKSEHLRKSLQTLTEIHVKTGKNFFQITRDDVANHLKDRYGNNFSINAYIAAMGHTQNIIDRTDNLFRTKPVFMERMKHRGKEVWDVKYKETDVEDERDYTRRAPDSTVQMATREEMDKLIEEIEKSRVYAPHKEQILDIVKLTMLTGARVSGATELTYGDIMFQDGMVFMRHENDLEDEKEVNMHLQEKAGHHRDVEFIEVRDDEAIALLTKLKDKFPPNTNPDRRIFEFREAVKRDKVTGEYKSGGQKLSDKTIKTKIKNTVTNCAARAGINDVSNGKTVSMHSGRKCFTQSRVDYYSTMTVEQLRAEVDRRIEKNREVREKEAERVKELKRQGKTKAEINERRYPNFEKKLQVMKDRINWVKKPTKENPRGERRTKEDRELNHKELVFLCTTFEIGHQRIDVLRFYAVYMYDRQGNFKGVKYFEKKD